MKEKRIRKLVNITLCITLLVTILSVTIVSIEVRANPMEIHGTVIWSNGMRVLEEDLIVSWDGHLILDNFELIMNSNSFDGQYKIEIQQGGQMSVINDSIIRAMARYPMAFTYKFLVYGTLYVDYSTIKWMWGDRITAPYAGGIQIGQEGSAFIFNSSIMESETHNIFANGTIRGIKGLGQPSVQSNIAIVNSNIFNAGICLDVEGHGIFIGGTHVPYIENNHIYENTGCGIYLSTSTLDLFEVKENTIYNNTIGIYIGSDSSPTICGNEIYQNKNAGIYCDHSPETITITNNEIYSSKVDQTMYYFGIFLNHSSPTIENNYISHYINWYSQVPGWEGWNSAVLCVASSPTIINNKKPGYTGRGFTHNARAITTIGTGGIRSSPLIEANDFINNYQAINYVYDSTDSNSITKNNYFEVIGNNIGILIMENHLSSPSIMNNNFVGKPYPDYNEYRKAIWTKNSAPAAITNNTIQGFYYGILNENSDPTITENVIIGDAISYPSNPMPCHGIYNIVSSPNISGNTIRNNSAEGIYFEGISHSMISLNDITLNGRGILLKGSSPIIQTNQIMNNKIPGEVYGAGIECWENSCPYVTGNNIVNNSDYGIYLDYSSPAIINNDNIANQKCGIWSSYSSPTIEGNTIINNSWDGIVIFYQSNAMIRSNDIIGNERTGIVSTGTGAQPQIMYNNILENFAGINVLGYSTPTIAFNTIQDGVTNGILVQFCSLTDINNNTISRNGHDGIELWLGNNLTKIKNNTISGNDAWGIHCIWVKPVNADSLMSDNPLLTDNGDGRVWQEWSLIVRVKDSRTMNPIKNASVEVLDVNLNYVWDGYTDDYGETPTIDTTEYKIHNGQTYRTYYTDHVIHASKTGYQSKVVTETMDANKIVELLLTPV